MAKWITSNSVFTQSESESTQITFKVAILVGKIHKLAVLIRKYQSIQERTCFPCKPKQFGQITARKRNLELETTESQSHRKYQSSITDSNSIKLPEIDNWVKHTKRLSKSKRTRIKPNYYQSSKSG
eukprot:622695_1